MPETRLAERTAETIAPPARRRLGAAARAHRNGPFTFTAITRSPLSSLMASRSGNGIISV
jgi:hypothetical protein